MKKLLKIIAAILAVILCYGMLVYVSADDSRQFIEPKKATVLRTKKGNGCL